MSNSTTPGLRFIAHRGYSTVHPENTMSAFQAAMDFQGGTDLVWGIELDVRLSGDRRVVVFHDGDLKRMCDCELLVHETPYPQLVEASVRSERMGCQKIPLLSDVLGLVDHRKAIFCELKLGDHDFGVMARGVAALLEEYSPRDDVVLHSFSADLIREIIPATVHLGVKYGLLFSAIERLEGKDELMESLDYLHPQFELLLDHPDELLDRGKEINTWTVNRPDDLRCIKSIDDGGQIVGIITNDISLCAP